MALVDKLALLEGICPPLDCKLTDQLLSEYISQEKRYFLADWEPATLDGGQFVEAAARIIYHHDSGKLDRRRKVDDCLSYIEDRKQQFGHNFSDRKAALHLARVLRTIYKFRSDRGAVHIDPEYTANQLDARLVIENSRWVLSELLRLFWSGNRQQVAKAIREILRYEVPAVGRYEDQLLVQRRDCTAEEEILLLLHAAGEAGLNRKDLGVFARRAPPKVTEGVQALEKKRQIIELRGGVFRLTEAGAKRIFEDLAAKLTLP
ncbi:MAG: hypothetical protein ACE145_21170 [Terriglobia bacterium]